ncbi:putative membrane protein [Hamadaea flava]|uniref:Integral membrane protein n=1 Tax=Hamadaea flava TaxID=1742688 RepID=A0ABV8LUD1_9ACTN|nr:hypothetical protein [Hamadaea flava]MCP2327775.1 putative membrane protein [Hamadaea flava]
MTQPPPEPPIRPEFRVPPMRPVQAPPALDDPAARRRRMRLGIIGAVVGIGIPLLIVAVGIVIALSASGTGSERWIGLMFVMAAGLVLVGPVQIVTGIVLTAVPNTRPFGVGFLIGSAIGVMVMAGACFGPMLGSSSF